MNNKAMQRRLSGTVMAALFLATLACSPVEDGQTNVNDGGEADAAVGLDVSDENDAAGADGTSPEIRETPPWDPTVALGGERPARVLLPNDYDTDKSWPLVVLLHGYSASSTVQDAYLGLSARRHAYGFITIQPDGTKNPEDKTFWNATEACCDFYGSGVDDLAYLEELIDEAEERLAIDPGRIYLLGHSNGGFMSYRLSCEFGSRIAAMASLAGSSFANPADCRAPAYPGILQIHGTLDAVILYDGGVLVDKSYPGAREVVERWAKRNECDDEPTSGESLNLDRATAGDETEVLRWESCARGSSAELWTIQGGSHIPTFTTDFIGKVLDFLFQHSRND
ncbi:MAG: alpha/beta hydrolase family esterase [Bradymonadaceae bacterium]